MPTFLVRGKILVLILASCISDAYAQEHNAQVRETTQTILTYPYSDPNPIPTLGINAKVGAYYPYFIFDGFSDEGIDKEWKVVTLANDFIEVTVLPEVGGKVMGAIEKSTENEFIYLNDVLKFRSIGVRGPWTSGGIEHNFGLDLGHAPWTAAEVDYVLRENPDGSVSCVVGGLDLASRTQWRVDIRLPKDKAYFQTNALWYNPTALNDAYLSWEVAAYKATADLRFYFPGDYYIGHGGDVHPWPIDSEGRNLAFYRENNFGSNKSYHVAGEFPNWFGGYFHDSGFGSGHWAPYDEAPGKKIWVWSLARSGAIWEDLLTDTDGQYIEAQSGVKFNQAGPKSGYTTPYNQLFMRPYYTETKSDYWFPVKETGGMVDASPTGTLNMEMAESDITLSFCPNVYIADTITVRADGELILTEFLDLAPMEVFRKTVSVQGGKEKIMEVTINGMLNYSTDRSRAKTDRPIRTSPGQDVASAEHLFRVAQDMYSMRDFAGAMKSYKRCLDREPTHSRALSKVAELYYRRAEYHLALECASRVLENNIYDPEANFMAGVVHQALDNRTRSKEYFSVSARSMEFRSASYLELARLYCRDQDFSTARHYAQKAIDYNIYNIPAREIMITAARKQNEKDLAMAAVEALITLDPLNHHARFEHYLLNPSDAALSAFTAAIRNELPYETYLELAIAYVALGLEKEAMLILEQSPAYPTVNYWLAYLQKDRAPAKSMAYLEKAWKQSPDLVFPFRLETIPILQWALKEQPTWKTNYYLGLIYWKALRMQDAKLAFEHCGNDPDYGMFYTIRGILTWNEKTALTDFERATRLDPSAWRTWYYLLQHHEKTGDYNQQWQVSKTLYSSFPDNPFVGIGHAKALLNVGQYQECLDVLAQVNVLPAEFANSGHSIYERASIAAALEFVDEGAYRKAITYLDRSRQWPENLGSGEPYEPDTRLQDFIQAYCERKLGNDAAAGQIHVQMVAYAKRHWTGKSLPHVYLNMLVFQREGLDEELATRITKWKKEMEYQQAWGLSDRLDSKEVQWVMAKYSGLEQLADTLEGGVTEHQPNSYFGLLLKTLQQVE